jgi:hypothetical protein
MTATASRSPAPWRPSPAQAEFIAAVCAPEGSAAGLESWCSRYATGAIDDGVAALLPFAYDRLVEIAPDAGITRRAHTIHLENSRLNLMRLARVLTVVRGLAEAGIPCLVLKGMALAVRYHASLGARAMGDVDLLVRPRDRMRAVDLLARLGWTLDAGTSTAFFHAVIARVQHAAAFSAGPPHSLDLHWHLHQFVTPQIEDALWDARETIIYDRTELHVLGPTDQIFHACCHAVQPAWKRSPRWMLDVHAILRADGPRVQWDRLVSTAQLTYTSVRLREAIGALDAVMHTGMPAPARRALAEARPRRWERRELALFEGVSPLAGWDRFRWHWNGFRRLRLQDAAWSEQPALLGFLDYWRLKRGIRKAASAGR